MLWYSITFNLLLQEFRIASEKCDQSFSQSSINFQSPSSGVQDCFRSEILHTPRSTRLLSISFFRSSGLLRRNVTKAFLKVLSTFNLLLQEFRIASTEESAEKFLNLSTFNLLLQEFRIASEGTSLSYNHKVNNFQSPSSGVQDCFLTLTLTDCT